MKDNILELFTISTKCEGVNWRKVAEEQFCPYLGKKCVKTRKSRPELSIGTCSVRHGVKDNKGIIICPHRYLQKKQIFMDCIHLLTLHEPGNELHRIAEVGVPGGSVDYVLASVKSDKVVDFVGIELQALDTTGTLWPHRQRFLNSVGVDVTDELDSKKPYGMNWKMTAKTILPQLHHKVGTFEQLGKRLVLVCQDALLEYMWRKFDFGGVEEARLGDPAHFHSYSLRGANEDLSLRLESRYSTDVVGIARCLGRLAGPNVELDAVFETLQGKISATTLLTV